MDMDCYENKCLRQLSDTEFYEKIDKDITPLTHECVKRYISGLQFDKMINDETAKYLKENSPKPGGFYTIPKIHKQGHPGRPIVSSNSHPTERISQFVDFQLQPLVTKLPSYIKDTTHFLNKLNSIGQLPDGVLLVTLDVSSLYTNKPHNDGIQACSEFLDQRLNPTIQTTGLCDLIRMIWGGQGGLNLPLPLPFNPGSRPVFFGSRPFAFFRLRNIAQCCVIFPFFSRFPPPWESRFPPPLLPPPVHLPPPFLPVSRPPVSPHMILTNNTFTFNGQHYRQINGTAMGTKMSPSYANLFMGKFEKDALAAASHSPLIWWRYIDDIFLLWTHGEEKLNDFITYFVNNLHPTIKFTNSFSCNEIPFLDVNVLLINGRLETDLYVKPTDKHQYLLKSSCHPSHTKQSIPFSMALEEFVQRMSSLTHVPTHSTHLIKRGYQHRFLKEEMEKVRQIPRSKALETSTKQENNRIPFVVTFNPALPNIRQIIFNNLNILRSSQRCKAAFPSPPLVSYRRCNNLRDILVRATHRRPPPKTPGAFRCNRSRCKTCLFITEGTTFYTFFSTNEQRQILHHISCSSSNLIYMIQCSRCKVQYIGETKRQLSDRFGEHRRAIEKAITHRHIDQPTAVSDHFILPGHSINDIELIPLELIHSNRDSIHKAREAFLISKGKTLEPHGINRRDET